MSKDSGKPDVTVIPIPDDSTAIAEPRTFRPVRAMKIKYYLFTILIFLAVTVVLIAFIGFVALLIYLDPEEKAIDFSTGMWLWGTVAYFTIGLLIVIIIMLLSKIYIDAMSYQVHGTEVVVFKGLLNKSEKHVPFRTITNISSRAGPFDRLLGIGSVWIETAGQAGPRSGPEERIEGIRVYKEVRDFILKELRKVRTSYATATESDQPIPSLAESNVVVKELQEIKGLLRDIRDNTIAS
ncbi:MAG: PH domain-containing protein [Candidatus Hodarchaeales archaeon]|jgi:membrane protein YdbS with pleckstrin-like domain